MPFVGPQHQHSLSTTTVLVAGTKKFVDQARSKRFDSTMPRVDDSMKST